MDTHRIRNRIHQIIEARLEPDVSIQFVWSALNEIADLLDALQPHDGIGICAKCAQPMDTQDRPEPAESSEYIHLDAPAIVEPAESGERWECNECVTRTCTQQQESGMIRPHCGMHYDDRADWHRIAAPKQEDPTRAGSPIWPDEEPKGEVHRTTSDDWTWQTACHLCPYSGEVDAEIARLRLLCEKRALECSAAQARMLQAEAEVERLKLAEEDWSKQWEEERQKRGQAEFARDGWEKRHALVSEQKKKAEAEVIRLKELTDCRLRSIDTFAKTLAKVEAERGEAKQDATCTHTDNAMLRARIERLVHSEQTYEELLDTINALEAEKAQAEAEVEAFKGEVTRQRGLRSEQRQRAEQAEADRDLHAADTAALRARVERLVAANTRHKAEITRLNEWMEEKR